MATIDKILNEIDTLDWMSRQALIDELIKRNKAKLLPIEIIRQEVCKYFKVSPEKILSPSRKAEIALARHIFIFLARRYTDLSYPAIGKECGNRGHATCIHACKRIEKLIRGKKRVADDISYIITMLQRKMPLQARSSSLVTNNSPAGLKPAFIKKNKDPGINPRS